MARKRPSNMERFQTGPHGGKGSWDRCDKDKFREGYEKIFGKSKLELAVEAAREKRSQEA